MACLRNRSDSCQNISTSTSSPSAPIKFRFSLRRKFSTSTSVRQEAYPSQVISISRMQKMNFSTDTSSHSLSLVQLALFMIFYETRVQNTDDAMLFKSVTAYTSIFGYTHRSTHFYSEVYFFFDVISQWIDLFFSHWKHYLLSRLTFLTFSNSYLSIQVLNLSYLIL